MEGEAERGGDPFGLMDPLLRINPLVGVVATKAVGEFEISVSDGI